MTVLTAAPADLHGYGRVIRKSSKSEEIQEIVEAKALTPQFAQAGEINSGIYAFTCKPLFEHIGSLGTQNAHGELYLTDMAAILRAAGERVLALEAESADEALGANTIAEMMTIDDKLRLSTARKLMAEGVTIFRPETSVIDSSVVVGADTVIEPFVQLLGETKVGKECRIRPIPYWSTPRWATGCLSARAASSANRGWTTAHCSAPMPIFGQRARLGRGRMWATLSKPRRFVWAKGPRQTI